MTDQAQLFAYQTKLGDVALRALRHGGEALLDQVEDALSVARRHLYRVAAGELPLVGAVEREIEESFDRAEALLRHASP